MEELRYYVDEYGLNVDKVELSDEYKNVIDEVNDKLDLFIKENEIYGMGSCHIIWKKKKEFLKEYGIEWYSPNELNPTVMFD